ncbi:MAG: CvpA family protein [Gammaproteobacteria bacterium]
MSWVDYAIFAILGLSALVGIIRGFVREVLSLVVWVLSFWIALNYASKLDGLFADHIAMSSMRLAVAFAALFLATFILGGIFKYLISSWVRKSVISSTDRSVGMLFGLVRGVLVVSVLVVVIGVTPLVQAQWWKTSAFVDYFQGMVLWVRDWLPHGVARSFIDGLKR